MQKSNIYLFIITLGLSIFLAIGPSFADCMGPSFKGSPDINSPASNSSSPSMISEPDSWEHLRIVADRSKTNLSSISTLLVQLGESLPSTLTPASSNALASMSDHIPKAREAVDAALAAGDDEDRFRFEMARATAETEIVRSALTRFKMSLNGIDLSPQGQSILKQLGTEIDDLRILLQSLSEDS